MASNFQEKFNDFMNHRNGPDRLSRDSLILAVALFIVAVLVGESARTLFLVLGLAAMIYSYWRMFSSKIFDRSRENATYIEKRTSAVNKVKGVFGKGGTGSKKASKSGPSKFQQVAEQAQKMAAQAKTRAQDKDHKYYACPKCGQTVRVPKGAGKIRVTCPKCGEKFEKKA